MRLLITLAALAGAAFAQVPAIDWEKQKAEALRHYRALTQIDTTNPPGNETRAVSGRGRHAGNAHIRH